MKFEARSLGVFEILTPRQESQEVFDADRFRQVVNSLLERKVRQLVVDLSGIDYLYSDAINALVSINRRILEQAGRMSLLAPQPKVHEILMRSGLDSLFRIYKSEAELSAESMELLRQSSLISRSEQTPSSSGYQASMKTPAPIPEGPHARQQRRRSGFRKDIAPRRPAGRNSVPPPADSEHDTPYAEPSLTGSSTGSSFPSAFAWDEKSAPPPAIPVPPPAQGPSMLPPPAPQRAVVPPSPEPVAPLRSTPLPTAEIPPPPTPPGSLSEGFEIQHGISLPEDSLPPVDQPSPTFFPPPQVMDEDMPTMQFRIPPQGE